MVLKLYKLDPSPPARAAMMVTDLINVPVEMITVDLFAQEHLSKDYLKKNPIHTVPMLEDGDLVLFDSHAIITYLIDAYGKDESLYPKDPKKRGLVNQMLFFDTGYLFPRLRNITYPALFENVKTPTAKQMAAITEAYDFVEQFLTNNKWLAGDRMTIADISCVADVSSLDSLSKISPEKYPKICAWLAAMEKQPFYQKHNTLGLAGFDKLVKDRIVFEV